MGGWLIGCWLMADGLADGWLVAVVGQISSLIFNV
jgi:hypothetical protein